MSLQKRVYCDIPFYFFLEVSRNKKKSVMWENDSTIQKSTKTNLESFPKKHGMYLKTIQKI